MEQEQTDAMGDLVDDATVPEAPVETADTDAGPADVADVAVADATPDAGDDITVGADAADDIAVVDDAEASDEAPADAEASDEAPADAEASDEAPADAEASDEAPVEEAAAESEANESAEQAPMEQAADEPVADEPVEEASAEAPVEETGADEPAAAADVADEDALFEEEAPAPRVISPYNRPGRWYVVHTQSGHEKKAQKNLAARTASMNMEEKIYETVIPMEDVAEFRNGKKVIVQKKMFPGYLLVRAEMDDDAWYVIRNTPSIVNFVGSGGKPSPLRKREVENFLHIPEEGGEAESAPRTKARLEYGMGETVRVKEGPFADFSGEIVEINEDQLKVKVLVNIFGRETPVELEFSQIARL